MFLFSFIWVVFQIYLPLLLYTLVFSAEIIFMLTKNWRMTHLFFICCSIFLYAVQNFYVLFKYLYAVQYFYVLFTYFYVLFKNLYAVRYFYVLFTYLICCSVILYAVQNFYMLFKYFICCLKFYMLFETFIGCSSILYANQKYKFMYMIYALMICASLTAALPFEDGEYQRSKFCCFQTGLHFFIDGV